MVDDKMRQCVHPVQIMAYFNEIIVKRGEVTAWQVIDGKRLIIRGIFQKVEAEFLMLGANSQSAENLLKFEIEREVYLHCPHKNFLAKTKLTSNQNKALTIEVPKDIRLEEARDNQRFYFQRRDDKEISIYFDKLSEENPSYFIINDLSTTGVGVIIEALWLKKMKDGDKIFIKSMSDHDLPGPIGCEFIHSRPWDGYDIDNPDDDYFLVGLKFDSPLEKLNYLPDNLPDENNSRHPLKKRKDGFFYGYTELEQQGIFHSIGMKDVTLCVAIKEADEFLGNLQYLTSDMKRNFLSHIDFKVLGTALRVARDTLVTSLLENTSSSLASEVLQELRDPRSGKEIHKAQQDLIKKIRELERKGLILLDEKMFGTYV